MCATCGCDTDGKTTMLNLQTGTVTAIAGGDLQEHHSHKHDPHEHVHADGTRYSYSHDHAHSHGHDGQTHGHENSHDDHGQGRGHTHDHTHGPAGEVHTIEKRILAKNDAIAGKTRAWLSGREILAVNLVSAPGSGKTTLLERTVPGLANDVPLFVIEGDQASANDGERIRSAGAPVVQINTGTGCHLDAEMVTRGLSELKPAAGSIVFIENVGNLVCPALFDLGERAKVVIFSVTEGEDKPLKYPHMFRAASAIIISKIDLVPHLDFSLEKALANIRLVNPEATVLKISARTGEGLQTWRDWLRNEAALAHEFMSL
jgi:hydrogenase nickel incorporation protein HypB